MLDSTKIEPVWKSKSGKPHGNFKSLEGKKFGRLLVLERVGSYRTKGRGVHTVWKCLCDCGNECFSVAQTLRAGHVQSCGCLWKEAISRPLGHSARTRIFDSYRRHARKRGLPWKLTADQFYAITQQACHYCGLPPSNSYKPPGYNGGFVYSGVDRVINEKGYLQENVVPCCAMCNHAKKDLSLKDFIAWIRRAYKYLASRYANALN